MFVYRPVKKLHSAPLNNVNNTNLSVQIVNFLVLKSCFHFVSTLILWPVNGTSNSHDQPVCCVANTEKSKLATRVHWNVANKLFTNKIKITVEITLQHFFFRYVLSLCLYLYPVVCCLAFEIGQTFWSRPWMY